jgi:hypothetical protein
VRVDAQVEERSSVAQVGACDDRAGVFYQARQRAAGSGQQPDGMVLDSWALDRAWQGATEPRQRPVQACRRAGVQGMCGSGGGTVQSLERRPSTAHGASFDLDLAAPAPAPACTCTAPPPSAEPWMDRVNRPGMVRSSSFRAVAGAVAGR